MKYYDKTQFGRDRTPGDPQRFYNVNSLVWRCGAAGYFSYTGDMDFAIVIRTMVLEKGKLMMRAGAGIVADSDPIKEFQETVNKSKAVFAAAQFATTL